MEHTVTAEVQVDGTAAEDILETGPFSKLAAAITAVHEHEDAIGIYDESASTTDMLIPPKVVSSLRKELLKLGPSGFLNRVPTNTLVRLLDALDSRIVDAARLRVSLSGSSEGDDVSCRIVCATEAALAAGAIITAPDMPKQVFQEEVIEHMASLARTQLVNTVYPHYDPDTMQDNADDNEAKDDKSSGSSKRRRLSSSGRKKEVHISRSVLEIYSRICELVQILSRVVVLPNLADSIVLEMSHIGVSPFFAEGALHELQLHALEVSRMVFTYYPTRRQVVVDEIMSNLGKLPTAKRSLRMFRLADGGEMQMVTGSYSPYALSVIFF